MRIIPDSGEDELGGLLDETIILLDERNAETREN